MDSTADEPELPIVVMRTVLEHQNIDQSTNFL